MHALPGAPGLCGLHGSCAPVVWGVGWRWRGCPVRREPSGTGRRRQAAGSQGRTSDCIGSDRRVGRPARRPVAAHSKPVDRTSRPAAILSRCQPVSVAVGEAVGPQPESGWRVGPPEPLRRRGPLRGHLHSQPRHVTACQRQPRKRGLTCIDALFQQVSGVGPCGPESAS